MKIRNKIFAFLALILVVGACKEEVQNPVLTDADLKVFFLGVGDNVKNVGWEGYNVLVGESVTVDLQVSPKDGTGTSWQLEDGTVLNNTLSYTYAPMQEELQRTLFIASRGSGVADTTQFNFRGVLSGETSIVDTWQNFEIEQGGQTGTFTAEFDAIPAKDTIDAVVGFNTDIASTFSNLSCIVRFNSSGKIDAHNGTTYVAANDIAYLPGMTYHFRLEVDATTMKYDAFVTPQGGTETEVGAALDFRNKTSNLKYWSIYAGSWGLTDPGTHRVFNMEITTHTLNEAPVFAAIEDQQLNEGISAVLDIVATDPLGGFINLTAQNLPRFATFVDLGGGKGTLTLEPYDNCGGCDLGDYAISIIATNKVTTSEQVINVSVVDPFAAFTIIADAGDGTLSETGHFDDTYIEFIIGKFDLPPDWPNVNGVAIVPFQLPELPEGMEFNSVLFEATFNFSATWGAGWFDASYDLYAIPYRSESTILASDYFIGAYDTDVNNTAIMEGFFTDTDALGTYTSSAQAGTDLAIFINNQYANGAKPGDYVFLRVNQHRDGVTWLIAKFETSETANVGNEPKLRATFKNK